MVGFYVLCLVILMVVMFISAIYSCFGVSKILLLSLYNIFINEILIYSDKISKYHGHLPDDGVKKKLQNVSIVAVTSQ